MINLDGGAYGRVYNITTLSLGSLAEKLKRKLDSERVLVYGNKQKNVSIAASFCGAGCDDEAIAFAVQNKADVFISSDIKHHQIAELVARGINVIVLTHYAAEAYGMKKIYQKLESKISVHTSYYTDEELL
jgi:putative NIF3 family GTP cyclohydrolase 1 type 2